MTRGHEWSRQAHRGFLWSLRTKGWWVEETGGLDETIKLVGQLEAWTRKPDHVALNGRGPMPRDKWGRRGSRQYQRWLLQGFPGVGVGLADEIIGHYGRVPLRWDDGVELTDVKGIGVKTAAKMMEAL